MLLQSGLFLDEASLLSNSTGASLKGGLAISSGAICDCTSLPVASLALVMHGLKEYMTS